MTSNPKMMKLLEKVVDQDAKGHMIESFKCFKAGAYRASIVMTCIALFDHLRKHTVALAVNNTLGAFEVKKQLQADLDQERAFERHLLEGLSAKRILDRNQAMFAEDVLNLRNRAAHPNDLELTKAHAFEAFSNTINHFLSRKVLNHLAPVVELMKRLEAETFFPEFEFHAVTRIVRHELAKVDGQSGYPILIEKLAGAILGKSGSLQVNAETFLTGLCTFQRPELRPLIHQKAIDCDPYNYPKHRYLIGLLAMDPELLSLSNQVTVMKLDRFFADACRQTPEEANSDQSDHPMSLYRGLINHLDGTTILSALPLTIQVILEKFRYEPDIALGLTKPALEPTVRQSIYDSMRGPNPKDEQRIAEFFLVNDEQIAKSFHSDDVIDLFRSMSDPSFTGRIDRLRKSSFEDLGHMKKVAVAGLGDDHDEIKALSLHPRRPHSIARPPLPSRRVVSAGS